MDTARLNALYEAARNRILIIDGAMGTMIQRHKLGEDDFRNHPDLRNHPHPLKGDNDLLAVTRPDVIGGIHREYLEAGADIIETNTFSATTVAQADYRLEHFVRTINLEAARIAREAADEYTRKTPGKPRFVAGSMGPTNRLASMSPDVNDPGYRAITFDQLRIAFKEQADALLDGGADLLLIETITDTLNAKAALFAIQEIMDERGIVVPIMVSGTITDASGRTLSGQTTEAFMISVGHAPLFSIGLNCALGAKDLHPYLETMARHADAFVSAYPNAGLPNEFGHYDQSPAEMGAQMEVFMKEGLVNIVGGCCGTTPDHIRVIAGLAAVYPPRPVAEPA